MILAIAGWLFVVQEDVGWYLVIHGIVGCLFVVLEGVEWYLVIYEIIGWLMIVIGIVEWLMIMYEITSLIVNGLSMESKTYEFLLGLVCSPSYLVTECIYTLSSWAYFMEKKNIFIRIWVIKYCVMLASGHWWRYWWWEAPLT